MFGLLYEENLRFSHPFVVAIELKQEKKTVASNGENIPQIQNVRKKRKGWEMDWFEKKKSLFKGKKKKELVFEEKEACVVKTHRLDTNMVECMHIKNKLKA